jgi:hypothetical protein
LSTYATASALLVRRDLFAACGGFDARIPLSADTLLYLQIVAMSGTAYVARPLAAYRDHAGSVTRLGPAGATEISKSHCIARALELLGGRDAEPTPERRLLERYLRFRLNSARCSTGGLVPDDVRWLVPAILDQVPGWWGAAWLRGAA